MPFVTGAFRFVFFGVVSFLVASFYGAEAWTYEADCLLNVHVTCVVVTLEAVAGRFSSP